MSCTLIVNPFATTSSGWSRELIVRSVKAMFQTEVYVTNERSHAITIAREARKRESKYIIVLGGDGTVNEVINGLLDETVLEYEQPILAVIPGGLANVFTRSLGFSADAISATGEILESLEQHQTRKISLGTFNDRWFSFNAGIGLDAGILSAMEALRAEGRKASPGGYLITGLKHYFDDTLQYPPNIHLENDRGETIEDAAMVIIQNAAPWSYVGPLSLDFATEASFDHGLDAVALTELTPSSIAAYLAEAAARIPTERRSKLSWLHDCNEIQISATRPYPAHVDGDSIGDVTFVRVVHHKDALNVAIPS
ncbi:MAG: diacylglycerol/lipid kinase family protein [Candidatus Nanopelagicales bacterium]